MSMKIYFDDCHEEVPYQMINFSDGTVNIKILGEAPEKYSKIVFGPEATPADVYWNAALAQNAIKNMCEDFTEIEDELYIAYLPNARADRVFEKGNANPLMLFTAIFQCFDRVYLCDPHSNAHEEWSDNVEVVPQWFCLMHTALRDAIDIDNYDAVVAPDKGASLKTEEVSRNLDLDIIQGHKVRCKETGQILETTIVDEWAPDHKKVLICDDICDGGGTFLPLAKLLRERGAEQVDLYVTHGIFAKGLDQFYGLVDNIYAFQLIGGYVSQEDIEDFNSKF